MTGMLRRIIVIWCFASSVVTLIVAALAIYLSPALIPEFYHWKERSFYDERRIGLEQSDASNYQSVASNVAGSETVNILSIDGGGVFGVIPATVLKGLTNCLHLDGSKKELWEYFDLISGNSTGSIIAAGLVTKIRSSPPFALTADELSGIYRNEAKNIFSPSLSSISAKVAKVLFSKSLYNDNSRLRVISLYLKDSLSKDALTDFLIPFYDITSGPIFYTRNHGAHERTFKGGYTDFSEAKFARMVDLVMYSSAAPIYFDPYKGGDAQTTLDIGQRRLPGYIAYDGALYQNNPTLLAIMEARRDHPRAHLNVLSLGDGISYRGSMLGPLDFENPKNNVYSLLLLPAFMEGESRAVDEYLRSDPGLSYTRIDVPIPSGTSLSMDDGSDEHMHRLLSIADSAAALSLTQVAGVCKLLKEARK